jgi:hypothetical protein
LGKEVGLVRESGVQVLRSYARQAGATALADAAGPQADALAAAASGTGADEVLDQQARAAYRQRLTALDEDLTEAEAWHDTERASRLRAEKDFLVRELAAATGLDQAVRTGTRCSYTPPDG